MTALYMMNTNLVQATSNGDVALNEAEAGLSELLVRIAQDQNYGRNGEGFNARQTSEFTDEEAYHVVSFDPSSSFPYSVNNVEGDSDVGYGGRSVPSGSIHAVITGFCRGQFRSLEVVIDKPSFPFALASSGPIKSSDPLTVYGIRSTSNLDEAERPGHVVSNSIYGIEVDAVDGSSTQINGYIKSIGPIQVDLPAEVTGGLRPFSDITELPRVDFSEFRNQGSDGVAQIMDEELYSEAGVHVLDISYHSPHDLTFHGPVEMRNGFLWVKGDLVINGPLYGKGAIVVEDGNLQIRGGVERSILAGLGDVAILSQGDIRISGSGNFFRGVLYSEGNLDLDNVGVLGAVIANSDDPTKGKADLEKVTIIANPESIGSIDFVIRTSSRVTETYDGGRMPIRVGGPFAADFNNGFLGQDPNIGPGDAVGFYTIEDLNRERQNGRTPIAEAFLNTLQRALDGENPPIGIFPSSVPGDPGADIISGHAQDLANDIARVSELVNILDDEERDEDEHSEAETELAELEDSIREQAELLEVMYYDYTVSRTGQGTSFHGTQGPGSSVVEHEIDTEIPIHIDLNEFLPVSDQIKVTYWQLFNRKL